MNPFWRELSLSDEENILLHHVYQAHAESVLRDNCSSVAVQVAAAGGCSLPNAIISALSTLGNRHAPLEQTYEFLNQPHPEDQVSDFLERGQKIPGWGNSFHKGPDPVWEPVSNVLQKHFGVYYARINEVTAALHGIGMPLYPNPSCFTAITAIILQVRKELAPHIFINGRLLGWYKLYNSSLK
jgi:citrate synthase